MTNTFKFIVSVGTCFLVAALGSIVTTPSISTWYAALEKPFFNPPNWIFGPVWSLLYLMMGISLYLVWSKKSTSTVRHAITIFGIQLLVNFLWSFVFFYLHQPLLAFITILVLWSAILYTITIFKPISKPASYLLVPYLLWVSFASILNVFIMLLN